MSRNQKLYFKLPCIEHYLFLSGTVYHSDPQTINKDDQCFCQDMSLRNAQNPQGQCYPQQLCNDCNLNLSGSCPQESNTNEYPGV